MSSELAPTVGLTAAVITFWALFQHIRVTERPRTEAARVCWCLFMNLSDTADQATSVQEAADLIRAVLGPTVQPAPL